jgi:hypothetical protein
MLASLLSSGQTFVTLLVADHNPPPLANARRSAKAWIVIHAERDDVIQPAL